MDEPHGELKDSGAWLDRRTTWANEWKEGFLDLGITTVEIQCYKATGKNNGALPIEIMNLAKTKNIIISMPQFSATAPLHEITDIEGSQTRVVSMPGLNRQFETTFFEADYSIVSKRAKKASILLDNAIKAKVIFSNKDEMIFDLRNRKAKADTGSCQNPGRLTNFPAGEAYKTLYEGVKDDNLGESKTEGVLPIMYNNRIVRLKVSQNKASTTDEEFKKWLDYPNRNNIAEFAIGVNYKGKRTGITLGDEKLQGAHIALARSSHLGGKVDSDVHQDFIYAEDDELHITKMTLIDSNEEEVNIIDEGKLQLGYLD